MVFKRKDKKGRNLRSGECQRKDGRYQYEYTDLDEEQRFVLNPRIPCQAGKDSVYL